MVVTHLHSIQLKMPFACVLERLQVRKLLVLHRNRAVFSVTLDSPPSCKVLDNPGYAGRENRDEKHRDPLLWVGPSQPHAARPKTTATKPKLVACPGKEGGRARIEIIESRHFPTVGGEPNGVHEQHR